VVRITDPGDQKMPAGFLLDLGKDKGKRVIQFDKPEIKATNAIKTELESFYSAIINNTVPPVTINDGYTALEVAHMIIDRINQSAGNL
jgi:hypothetical protein